VKGMKEESGCKKDDRFERFICVRENLNKSANISYCNSEALQSTSGLLAVCKQFRPIHAGHIAAQYIAHRISDSQVVGSNREYGKYAYNIGLVH